MCIRNNYKFANFRWGLVVNLAREKSQNLFLFACNKTTTTRTRMRSQCLRVGRGRDRDRYRGLGHELVALAPRCMETWILDLPMVMQSLSLIQSLFLITSLNHLHGESNGVASVHSLGSRNWDQQSAHLLALAAVHCWGKYKIRWGTSNGFIIWVQEAAALYYDYLLNVDLNQQWELCTLEWDLATLDRVCGKIQSSSPLYRWNGILFWKCVAFLISWG